MVSEFAFSLVYDNQEEDPPVEDSPVEDPPVEDPPSTPPVKEPVKAKTFTQEDVNKILAEDRRKHQTNRKQLIEDLQNLRNTAQLTGQEKEQLETRIEQLQRESMTQQELDKKEREKLTKEYQKQLKEREDRAGYWQGLYEREKIQRELTDAAIANKAISPTQLVALVRPNTKLIERLNKDGKPTGEWETRVQLQDQDEKGEEITLEVNATEAIKRMSEMPTHWNLFNSGASGGIGGFNQQIANNNLRGTKPPTDPAEYRKWRNANIPAKANGKK